MSRIEKAKAASNQVFYKKLGDSPYLYTGGNVAIGNTPYKPTDPMLNLPATGVITDDYHTIYQPLHDRTPFHDGPYHWVEGGTPPTRYCPVHHGTEMKSYSNTKSADNKDYTTKKSHWWTCSKETRPVSGSEVSPNTNDDLLVKGRSGHHSTTSFTLSKSSTSSRSPEVLSTHPMAQSLVQSRPPPRSSFHTNKSVTIVPEYMVKKKRNHGIWWFLFALIVCSFLALGGWYLRSHEVNFQLSAQPSSRTVTTPTPKNTFWNRKFIRPPKTNTNDAQQLPAALASGFNLPWNSPTVATPTTAPAKAAPRSAPAVAAAVNKVSLKADEK